MNIEMRKITQLKHFERNPRHISDKDLRALMNSIEEFGFVDPAIIDENGVIIGGNQRVRAARKLGMREVPVVVIEGLSESQKKALNIALNKISGDWSETELVQILAELEADVNIDATLTGFDEDELQAMIQELETEFPEEEFYEPPGEPSYEIERGEMWQLGEHRLMCGDATGTVDLDTLVGKDKAVTAFLDPPYELEEIEWLDNIASEVQGLIFLMHNDRKLVEALCRQHARFLYFYVWFYMPGMALWKSAPISVHTLIAVLTTDSKSHYHCVEDGWGSVFQHIREGGKNKLLPYQKPMELVTGLLKHHPQRGPVLDIFGGSGTTMIACEQLQRRCLMMEIDPEKCSIIMDRYEQYTGKSPRRLSGPS